MRKLFVFLIGLIVGILLTIFVLFIFSLSYRQNSSKEVSQVQYIDVKGKHGNVQLHTGMIKDSVQILVGKPDEVNLQSVGNSTIEDWGYKLKNEYVPDLSIDFEDGKLRGVRQN